MTTETELAYYISTWDLEYVRGLLSLVTYKAGWTITAFRTPVGDRVWVLIDAEVPDSEDPSLTTRIGVRAVVPAGLNADQFYDWLGRRLIRVERHESREFFQVGGRPWNSPHQREQLPCDYKVRKLYGKWQAVKLATGEVMDEWDTWWGAYKGAWWCVIDDDSRKGEDMVNG